MSADRCGLGHSIFSFLCFATIILLTLKSLQSCDITRRLMMADDLAVILALLRILLIMIL